MANSNIAAFPYYGGKHRLAKKIVPIIESIPHKVYVEPFGGGLSVLLASAPNNNTVVINDMNRCLITLYKVLQCYPEDFLHALNGVPFSRYEYQQSKFLLAACDPTDDSFDNVMRIAIATYVTLCMSFSNVMGDDGGWRVDRQRGSDPKTWQNRKQHIASVIALIADSYIDCADYRSCIRRWDSRDTLFYVDPPYPGTDLGHYGSTAKAYSVSPFTAESLTALHECLGGIQGKFILSGYDTGGSPIGVTDIVTVPTTKLCGTKGKSKPTEMLWIKRG